MLVDFEEILSKRLNDNPDAKNSLLAEVINLLLENDIATSKDVLNSYIIATIGFEELARTIDMQPDDIMTMLNSDDTPNMKEFFNIITTLQKMNNMSFTVILEDDAKQKISQL